MHPIALNKNSKKSSLSGLQETFNRLRRKNDQLRNQLEILKKEFEHALVLYHSDLKPMERKAGNLITEFILRVKILTQDSKVLSNKEKKTLRMVFEESLELVFSILPHGDIHDELKDLYREIFGKTSVDEFHEGMSELKKMFKEEGGISDIDISNLNPNDSLHETLFKLSESLNAAMSEKESFNVPPPPKQKSKKELDKEKKARDLEDLQSKGLNNVYKRLVKLLHPDLEQDPIMRNKKEGLMKRLTVAYENNDIISLLALESEWLGYVDGAIEIFNEETYKIYNSLLKDQIEELKQELKMIFLHPRYIEIHHFLQNFSEKPIEGINFALSDCRELIDQYSLRIDDLSGKDPLKKLKEALASLGNQFEISQSPDFVDLFFLSNLMEELDLSNPKTNKKKKCRN